MAAQICIKMALGTFFQLVNIANRFLRFFSKLNTPIRSIFPRVHGNPIFRLDYNGPSTEPCGTPLATSHSPDVLCELIPSNHIIICYDIMERVLESQT